MPKTSRDDPLQGLVIRYSNHRMGLAASGLPICKNSSIVPLNNMLDKRIGSFAVNMGLLGGLGEDGIIGKTFDVIGLFRFGEVDLVVIVVNSNYWFATPLLLGIVEGTNSYNDLDTFSTHLEGYDLFIIEELWVFV